MVQLKQFRKAVIFGASGNIGTAIAQRLAASGWSLALHYWQHEQSVVTLRQKLRQAYPRQSFTIVKADLSDPQLDPATLYATCGDFQALVFAQGTTIYQLLTSFNQAQIQMLFQLHLLTPISLIQAAQSRLLQHQHSRIVFIGSIYGAVGSAMEVPYSAVKGGQSSFVNAYAREVAGSGLSVNVVAPGAVQTQMNADFTSAELADLKADIPAGRLAQPQEIATWVDHLLAPDADYLTGQTLYVNGGWLK